MRVVVGIATRGDRDLGPLVAALQAQSHPPVRVLVATQGAAPGVRRDVPGQAPVTVLPVAGSGYSRGRNVLLRYLRLAAAHWDVAAFLDDDEHPDPRWLEAHLRTLEQHRGDVCLGPVRRLWPAGAPSAVRRADLPRRADCPDGPYNDDGRTGNYALRSRLLAADATVFDDRLGGSGGEDTAFFRALRAGGARVVWSSRAVVHEEQTEPQCQVAAVLRRSYRNGRTLPFLAELGHSRHGVAQTVWGQRKRLPKAVLLALAGLLAARADLLLRGAWEAAYLAGLTTGLLERRAVPSRVRTRRPGRSQAASTTSSAVMPPWKSQTMVLTPHPRSTLPKQPTRTEKRRKEDLDKPHPVQECR